MFEKKSLMFYYCTTPLHMGAGTSVGAIDNPIQREVHTNHPMIAGSGLKGAVRHHVTGKWGDERKNDIIALFGAESNSKELTAGALSFTDANLVAFPVRSLKNTFVYITSPNVLARIKRMALHAGCSTDWTLPEVQSSVALASENKSCIGNKLCLEAYEFDAKVDENTKKISAWLSENCLSDNECNAFFKKKIKEDLFIVANEYFDFFVKQSTVVEPHVKIDDKTGTAVEGALFYTENLPPESILAGIVLASVERKRVEGKMSAETCLNKGLEAFGGDLVQMGGDSTTGRGLVLINAVKGV